MSELPDVFLRYQQELMASVDHHAVTLVEKSRRTGYSWAAAAVAALRAASVRTDGGMDVLYIGYNQEMTREFIDYVADWAKAIEPAAASVSEQFFDDPDRPEKQIKAFRIDFASGYKVLALPSVPRALRGMQGLVIIDEAAFHDDLPGVLKSAFALLIWGGKVVVISTHNGDTNPFAVLVDDVRAGRLPYNLLRCTFDDALADGLYRRICLTTGKTWSPEAEKAWRTDIIAQYGHAADEELFVTPSASTGSFLPGPLIEARAESDIPVVRWQPGGPGFAQWPDHLRAAELRTWCDNVLAAPLAALDPKNPHVFGLDFARRGDLTVLWVLAIGAQMVRRTVLVVELRDCPFKQQEQVLYHVADRLPRLRAGHMDATGNGMYLAEVTMQRYGALILQVMMNEPWYREEMPPLKAAFEDALIVVPRDRELIDDLRGLTMVRGVARIPERTRNDAGLKRHGDGAIALALAYSASRANHEAFGYTPVIVPRMLPGASTTRFGMSNHDAEDDYADARERERAL